MSLCRLLPQDFVVPGHFVALGERGFVTDLKAMISFGQLRQHIRQRTALWRHPLYQIVARHTSMLSNRNKGIGHPWSSRLNEPSKLPTLVAHGLPLALHGPTKSSVRETLPGLALILLVFLGLFSAPSPFSPA